MNPIRLGPWGLALATFVAAALVVVVQPSVAHAQQERSFSPQIFHVAPGPDEFVTVESAVPLRHKSYGLGLTVNWARNEFSIFNYDAIKNETTSVRANLLANVIGADVWAAFGLFGRF